MSKEMIDLIGSLVSIIHDENALLRDGRRIDLPEVAAAKLRLTAELERSIAALSRNGSDWQAELPADERVRFTEAAAELQAAAANNEQLLRRQIELSRELMDAISAEAKRLSGTRSEVYGARGGLQRTEYPAPIAVNTSL